MLNGDGGGGFRIRDEEDVIACGADNPEEPFAPEEDGVEPDMEAGGRYSIGRGDWVSNSKGSVGETLYTCISERPNC